MEANIAAAKIRKYATSESGDTLEIVERPGGGISCVLADGQRSGKSAKAISNVVTRKAIGLLAEGVHDGAAVRAASDYLYTYRAGKVLATLNVLSIDLLSQSIVISRNNPDPVILVRNGHIHLLDEPSDPVGTRRGIRPSITEIPLEAQIVTIVYTDGLTYAGNRTDRKMDIVGCVQTLLAEGAIDPQKWAVYLLNRAMELDEGRPSDDISVVVTAIIPRSRDNIRRMSASMPL